MSDLHALEQFFERLESAASGSEGWLLRMDADDEWPSPCVFENRCWRPHKRDEMPAMQGLQQALAIQLPMQLVQFYGSFFSAGVRFRFDDVVGELLFAWNDEDFERLQQNLVGHALMKRRLKQPLTLFIGCHEDDETIISVDLAEGAVWLERPGLLPERQLARSIGEFLLQAQPVIE